MQPVLFNVGQQTISSLGLFLVISAVASLFVIWRLILIYELDKDKTIDLAIITFIGGLVFSRAYFVLFHYPDFNSPTKIFFFNRYPGLSFWGGFFGALVVLGYFCYRNKHKFWQMMDYLITALFLGISISSLGCLLGSCQYGLPSNAFFAVRQVGLIDKRFPLQIIEAIVFFVAFSHLWKKVIKFHFDGQIAAKGLMWLGVLKFILEFLRGDSQRIAGFFMLGHLYSLAVFALGVYAYYTQSTRRLSDDWLFVTSLTYKPDRRKMVLLKIKKNCYNLMVDWKLRTAKFGRKLPRRLNVKANPKEF